MLDEGIAELTNVVEGCARFSSHRVIVEADLRIARGLDYYTGTVFETRMSGLDQVGSICSGGRYDQLASDGRNDLSRRRHLAGHHPHARAAAVPRVRSTGPGQCRAWCWLRCRTRPAVPACDAIADALRARGIAAEVSESAAKYGRQIRYAERRGIPFVWFPMGRENGHEVKDIRQGEQVPADPATWQPPTVDLRPQVIARTGEDDQ